MTNPDSNYKIIFTYLDTIDGFLAAIDIPLSQRPLAATCELVDKYILNVKTQEENITIDGFNKSYLNSPWFNEIFSIVIEWYRQRYGPQFDKQKLHNLTGYIVILGVPYLLEVPAIIPKLGPQMDTCRLLFRDRVIEDEDPSTWIKSPPNFNELPSEIKEAAVSEARIISSLLRSINIKLTGITTSDETIKGFWNSIKSQHQQPGILMASQKPNAVINDGFWSLQMACECSFKLIIYLNTGEFPKTHDLFLLYDQASKLVSLSNRELLKNLPRTQGIMETRYHMSTNVSISSFYNSYKSMLRLVESSLRPLVSLRMGTAEILIHMPRYRPDPKQKK